MSDVYFDNVVGIGKLYLDYIFYEFENEPVLFMCRDEDKKIYICLCSEIRYGQKWIIVECDINTLRALVNEKIDIASAFLISREAIIINMDLLGNEIISKINIDDIDRLDLPKEGTYIRSDKEKDQYYLWKKEAEILLQSKVLMDMDFICGNESVSKYYFSEFYKILKIQTELYVDSMTKRFVESFDEMVEALKEGMYVKREYSILKKDKYSELIDDLNIDKSDADNYLEAA